MRLVICINNVLFFMLLGGVVIRVFDSQPKGTWFNPQDPSLTPRQPGAKRLLNEKIYIKRCCFFAEPVPTSLNLSHSLFLSFQLFLSSLFLSLSSPLFPPLCCSTHVYKWRRNLCHSQVDSLNLQGF